MSVNAFIFIWITNGTANSILSFHPLALFSSEIGTTRIQMASIYIFLFKISCNWFLCMYFTGSFIVFTPFSNRFCDMISLCGGTLHKFFFITGLFRFMRSICRKQVVAKIEEWMNALKFHCRTQCFYRMFLCTEHPYLNKQKFGNRYQITCFVWHYLMWFP